MSTTPLPPLPTPWIHDLSAAEGSQQHFAADQMQTYAQQARADLEAELKAVTRTNKEHAKLILDLASEVSRLSRGLRQIAASSSDSISAAQARAALKGTP